MAKCGNCKTDGMTVEHVRECYAASRGKTSVAVLDRQPVQAQDFQPMALDTDIPASCYAIQTETELKFYEVRVGKAGTKWDGYRFLDLLVGHPGTWLRYSIKGANRKILLATLAEDPKAAALLYSHRFTVCAACGSPLSDAESIARGFGPVCAEKF